MSKFNVDMFNVLGKILDFGAAGMESPDRPAKSTIHSAEVKDQIFF